MTHFLWAMLLAGVSFSGALYAGYHIRDLSAQLQETQAHLAFERKIAKNNKDTEADRDRIAEELKQSEEQIDKLSKEYQDVVSKSAENSCPLSDFDFNSLWHDGGTAGAKPAVKRRLRPPARKTPAP